MGQLTICDNLQGCSNATGQGMVKEKMFKFREKSGNFILSQEKLTF